MERDAQLYHAFLKGDDHSFVELIRLHQSGLTFFLHGYVHDLDTVEDLVEDTFVRLYARRPHFSTRYRFKTWLYTIAKNLTIDYLRKQGRQISVPLEEVHHRLVDPHTPEGALFQKEQDRALYRAMEQLSEEYRQVLYLKFFEDLSNAEIGKILKRNNRQVENLLYRSKQALRQILQKEELL